MSYAGLSLSLVPIAFELPMLAYLGYMPDINMSSCVSIPPGDLQNWTRSRNYGYQCRYSKTCQGDHLSQKTTCPRRPPVPEDHLSQKTTCPRRPPVPEDHLSQKTTCPRRPPVPEDHLSQKTTCPRRPPVPEDHLSQKTTCPRRPPVPEDHLSQTTTAARTKGCFSSQMTLAKETTCLQRPHFEGPLSGGLRQVSLYI